MEEKFPDCIGDMVEAVKDAIGFAEGNNHIDSSKDKKTVCAVSRAIKTIGEAAKKTPDSVRKRIPEIPRAIWQV